MRTHIQYHGYKGRATDGVLTYVDLSGCVSPSVITSLPDTVKTIVLNETAVITMFRALTKKNNVTQIELRGALPLHTASALRLNPQRMIQISCETHESTITQFKTIDGLSTVSLLSDSSTPIPVELIKKIPDNVKTVHVPLCISTEEVRALGESIQSLYFTSSIVSSADTRLCDALLEAVPKHIAVYGFNQECIRPVAIHEETSPMTMPSSSVLGQPAPAAPEALEPAEPADLYTMIREIRKCIEQDKGGTTATRVPSFFPFPFSLSSSPELAPTLKKQRTMTEEEKVAELFFASGR
ncbi:MAG: hypothetical protein ACOYKA_01245 [Legionellaceae bacterium]